MMLFASCREKSELPSMKQTFDQKDAIPFGTKVALWMMQSLYFHDEMKFLNVPLSEYYELNNDEHALYFSITKKFSLSEADAIALVNFLDNGNTVFISSNDIDTNFLKRVNIDKMFVPEVSWQTYLQDQWVELDSSLSGKKYGFYYLPFVNWFTPQEDAGYKVMGNRLNATFPNLIVMNVNKGKLILHSSPAALSNYFLLTKDNHEYFNKIVSLMPERFSRIYWDNYYTKNFGNKGGGFSTLGEIKKHPPLFKAFILSLLLLGMYVLFFGKRRQRVIPVIKPVTNSSVKFAEAIAGVYRRENDNKDIAKKMITYFYENLRTRFYIQSSTINDDFVEAISRKSGYPIDRTQKLFSVIRSIESGSVVTDQQLLALNNEIQKFPKQK